MSGSGRYARFLTRRSQLRQPSAIRALQPLLRRPGVISLGGGMPNPSTFPLEGLSLRVRGGAEVSLSASEATAALQYSDTNGLPRLVQQLSELSRHFHGSAAAQAAEQSILVTTGSQDALTKAFEMVLEEEDALLLEEFTYSGSLAFLKPWGCRLVPVPTDAHGIVPSALRARLDAWDPCIDGRKPKVLYTIPTGSNPTGASLDLARRRELYAVCHAHDLLVLEDNPYFHLQLSEPWLPSLHSMDEDGRVLRFDSLSKVLSSGLRLGMVAGPKELVDRLVLHMQATSLHTSGVSQALTARLFDHWATTHEGGLCSAFEAHTRDIQAFYRAQRDAFSRLAHQHLAGLAEWRAPDAGMFFWIKILGVEGSARFAQRLIEEQGVLVVAGLHFSPSGTDNPYVRCSFSTASEQQMDDALARMAVLLRQMRDQPEPR
jgi:kynurenine/2-aminoadipate aminotransferase